MNKLKRELAIKKVKVYNTSALLYKNAGRCYFDEVLNISTFKINVADIFLTN
jgi:hypothetical protein